MKIFYPIVDLVFSSPTDYFDRLMSENLIGDLVASFVNAGPVEKQIFVHFHDCWNEEKISLEAMVVAQLTRHLLPTPEDPDSNPVSGNFMAEIFTFNWWKEANVDKESQDAPIFIWQKNNLLLCLSFVTIVTRLGNLLDFGQLFKAFGNSYFAQISHILRQFL